MREGAENGDRHDTALPSPAGRYAGCHGADDAQDGKAGRSGVSVLPRLYGGLLCRVAGGCAGVWITGFAGSIVGIQLRLCCGIGAAGQ
jgi:hypothetical protein